VSLHCFCVRVWLGVRFHAIVKQYGAKLLGELVCIVFVCVCGWECDSIPLEIRKAVRGSAFEEVSLHCFCVRVWLGVRFHAVGKHYRAKLLGE